MTYSTEGNVVAVIRPSADITAVIYSIDQSEYTSIEQSISHKAAKLFETKLNEFNWLQFMTWSHLDTYD